MPNIGFTELLLISIVALLVLGPEKLPQAVRTAALWVGRARRSFNKVRAEIEREINADDIRRQLHNESILADLDEAKEKAGRLTRDTKDSFSRFERDVRHGIDSEAEKNEKKPDETGKHHNSEKTVTRDGTATDDGSPDSQPSGPAAADEPQKGPEDGGVGDESEQQAERSEKAGETEENKPVTDFYNNPPDQRVTVQGRKFKAGKDDDDKS
jgi:sec-independent protein translocase protein TatB